jgi:hypothetical protein
MAPRFPAEYSSGKLILPNAPLASTGQPALVKSLNLPTPHENLCKWGSNLHSIASISAPKLQNQALAARTVATQCRHPLVLLSDLCAMHTHAATRSLSSERRGREARE